jgi:hypothetical protein
VRGSIVLASAQTECGPPVRITRGVSPLGTGLSAGAETPAWPGFHPAGFHPLRKLLRQRNSAASAIEMQEGKSGAVLAVTG